MSRPVPRSSPATRSTTMRSSRVSAPSELISRALRQTHYAGRPAFDAEFLRWTLSDGAGAVVVESRPRPDQPSLRVDWVHLVSHAHENPVCMRAGSGGGEPTAGD